MRFSIEFSKAFWILLRHFFPIWGGIVILISLLGLIIAGLEEELSLSSGLYFAWVTGTMVGYGDITPTVGMTRFLAIIVAIMGIMFTGIVVAIAISAAKIAVESSISIQEFEQAVKERTQRQIAQKRRGQEKQS
jgi:hypothetical protein